MSNTIFALYFSPTKNTEKCVRALAKGMADILTRGDYFAIDLTNPEARESVYEFGPEDILIVGMPVYAGRVPNKIAPFITESIFGDATPAITLVTYGNRAYDDSLKELSGILYENGCDIKGAIAALGEHSFSDKLATGRPNKDDLDAIAAYGNKLAKALQKGSAKDIKVSTLPGRDLDKLEYYVPLKKEGTPAKFLKALVDTDETLCTKCGACREICPMGNFNVSLTEATGTCIKCQGCIKACPVGAKRFTDEDLLSHIKMIEDTYGSLTREIEFF